MYRERMERGIDQQARRLSARERSRRERWNAKSNARVTDPIRGTVVVPHLSKFAAILCAAEVWGCSWLEIDTAEVWAAKPEDKVAARPYII